MDFRYVLDTAFNSIKFLLNSKEFGIVVLIIGFVLWVVGIVYCDRVAFEKGYNVWLARVVGIFLPYAGPLYYWFRKNRRRHRRHRKHAYRPPGSWNTTYGSQR